MDARMRRVWRLWSCIREQGGGARQKLRRAGWLKPCRCLLEEGSDAALRLNEWRDPLHQSKGRMGCAAARRERENLRRDLRRLLALSRALQPRRSLSVAGCGVDR
jgi:hypothetical protein